MPLTVDDLVVYLREPVESVDLPALNQIVGMVNGLVADFTGPLTVEPARVEAIRLEVAARAWRNPDGYSSETIGGYTWRGDPTGRSGVYLTEAEHRDLLSVTSGNPDPGPWAGSLPYRR